MPFLRRDWARISPSRASPRISTFCVLVVLLPIVEKSTVALSMPERLESFR